MGSHYFSTTSKSVIGRLTPLTDRCTPFNEGRGLGLAHFLAFLRLTLPLVLDFPIPGTGSEHTSHSDDKELLCAVSFAGDELGMGMSDRADCTTSTGPIISADSYLSLPLVMGSSFPEKGSELSSSPEE